MGDSGQGKSKKFTKSLDAFNMNRKESPCSHSYEHECICPNIQFSSSQNFVQTNFLNLSELFNNSKPREELSKDVPLSYKISSDIVMTEISENAQKPRCCPCEFQKSTAIVLQTAHRNYTTPGPSLRSGAMLHTKDIPEEHIREKYVHYFMNDPLMSKSTNSISTSMGQQCSMASIENDCVDGCRVKNTGNQCAVDTIIVSTESADGGCIEDNTIFQKFFEFKQTSTEREDVYCCFKGCDKYLIESEKVIKNSKMGGFCSSETTNNKRHLKKFCNYNFDGEGETALFVSEAIRNRMLSEKMMLESSTGSISGRRVCADFNKEATQPNIQAKGVSEQDKPCKSQTRLRTKEDNSDVYSIEELKAMLHLCTTTFDKMPSSPVKIGEASFSEVYKIGDLIYKIIPFNQWYGIESFCKEAFILDVLRNETGVCKLVDRFLIKDGYSQEYLNAWDSFVGGDNPRPSQSDSDQLYGVLVMNDCGCDLEKYRFKNFVEIVDFIDQLLSTICNLEEKFRLEHRDMHWGNIMIKDTKVHIIDFNFARLETDKIVYTDLNAQEWLFEGDCNVDMQFEIYVETKRSCKSNWKAFNPKSNLLWIRYLLRKLELKLETVREEADDATRIKNRKMLGKIVQKAYEFADCKGLKKYFDVLRCKANLKINHSLGEQVKQI